MTSIHTIQQITGGNLSLAWANALSECSKASHKKITSAAVSFPVYKDVKLNETQSIKDVLDNTLCKISKSYKGNKVTETVANTIFPQSIWEISQGNRQVFYSKYCNMLPLIKRTPTNSRGTYFSRLVSYDSGDVKVNQLEHIIKTWQKDIHRLSALQAGIFHPAKDHSYQLLKGFPCLQQIVFQPIGVNGSDGLSVIAFYAKQSVIEKAYGNYLGLLRLGNFMAESMGLELKCVTCIASDLSLFNKPSPEYSKLIESVKQAANDAEK